MQRANSVSLWFGDLKSRRAMEKYIKIKDSKDGDFIPHQRRILTGYLKVFPMTR